MTPVTESVVGTFTQTETQLPVRIDARQVMEILGVEYQVPPGNIASAGGTSTDEFQNGMTQITKRSQSAEIALSDADCVDKVKIWTMDKFAEATETGGAGFNGDEVIWHDFASSGFGFLVASQSMFLAIDWTTVHTPVLTSQARLLYRLVKVSAEELIGLVSQ